MTIELAFSGMTDDQALEQADADAAAPAPVRRASSNRLSVPSALVVNVYILAL